MKKAIGYLLAYLFYYIGDLTCKISYKKTKSGQFCVDHSKYFKWFFRLTALTYQGSMRVSSNIQNWAKLDKPWQKVVGDK